MVSLQSNRTLRQSMRHPFHSPSFFSVLPSLGCHSVVQKYPPALASWDHRHETLCPARDVFLIILFKWFIAMLYILSRGFPECSYKYNRDKSQMESNTDTGGTQNKTEKATPSELGSEKHQLCSLLPQAHSFFLQN